MIGGRRVRLREIEINDSLTIPLFESEEQDAIIDEAIENDRPAPYGLICWPSAIRVAKELAEISSLQELRVLDIGAGNGLPALTAAALGAQVMATDIHSLTMLMLKEAAHYSKLKNLHVGFFDIMGDEKLPASDLLIAADMLYEADLAQATALRCFEAISHGASLIVADPFRRSREQFIEVLESKGVTVEFISKPITDHLSGSERQVGLWTTGPLFRRASNGG